MRPSKFLTLFAFLFAANAAPAMTPVKLTVTTSLQAVTGATATGAPGGVTLFNDADNTQPVYFGGADVATNGARIPSGGSVYIPAGAIGDMGGQVNVYAGGAGQVVYAVGGEVQVRAATLFAPDMTLKVGVGAALVDGAITQKSGLLVVTKATAAALTIADPVATADDGKTLIIVSATAAAHTVSNAAGSGFNGGGAASDIGTFAAAIGNGITVVAYQGKWYVVRNVGVTLA